MLKIDMYVRHLTRSQETQSRLKGHKIT